MTQPRLARQTEHGRMYARSESGQPEVPRSPLCSAARPGPGRLARLVGRTGCDHRRSSPAVHRLRAQAAPDRPRRRRSRRTPPRRSGPARRPGPRLRRADRSARHGSGVPGRGGAGGPGLARRARLRGSLRRVVAALPPGAAGRRDHGLERHGRLRRDAGSGRAHRRQGLPDRLQDQGHRPLRSGQAHGCQGRDPARGGSEGRGAAARRSGRHLGALEVRCGRPAARRGRGETEVSAQQAAPEVLEAHWHKFCSLRRLWAHQTKLDRGPSQLRPVRRRRPEPAYVVRGPRPPSKHPTLSSHLEEPPMSVRPIRTIGDPILRSAADPVRRFDDDLRTLVADMFETMRDVEEWAWPPRRSAWACRSSSTRSARTPGSSSTRGSSWG